jgi:hypothetical protein
VYFTEIENGLKGLLDRDYFSVSDVEIKKIRALLTVLAGERRWTDASGVASICVGKRTRT